MQHQQPPAEPIHTTTFNHVGPLGPTQHAHQAQMQHENLMKVLQIQVFYINIYHILCFINI